MRELPKTPQLNHVLRAFHGQPKPYPWYGKSWSDVHEQVAKADLTGDPIAQFAAAANAFYSEVELDCEQASVLTYQQAATTAHRYKLAVIALNPHLSRNALAIMAHPCVQGVLVDSPPVEPGQLHGLRVAARKDGLMPIWFAAPDRAGADAVAGYIRHARLKGMGVTVGNSIPVLTPDV